MDYRCLCDEILKSNTEILGVWLVRKVTPVEHAVKKGAPLPKPRELNKMFLQGAVMISQASTNEQMYGRVKSIMINHEILSAFLVPIDSGQFLAIGCSALDNPKPVLGSIERIVAKARSQN